MSQLISLPNPGNSNRRRFGRFAVAVPVDVVVLRSGVPSTIPGRSVDVGEGGVSAVLAGELQPGEAIGISLQLPFVLEPVQAKAVVRHHGPLPVSYTHLRAHETPEHLVCRLLLE